MKLISAQARLAQAREEEKRLRGEFNRIGWLRAAAALLAAGGLILLWQYQVTAGAALAAAAVLAFIWLVRTHNKLELRIAHNAAYLEVLEAYMGRREGEWRAFPEHGGEYLEQAPVFAADLDLLGKGSLFQYLCCAGTARGKEKLAGYLTGCGWELSGVHARQAAVAELEEQEELALALETLARQIAKNKLAEEGKVMDRLQAGQGQQESPWLLRFASWALPVVTLGALILGLLGLWPGYTQPVAVGGIVLALSMAFLGHGRNSGALADLFKVTKSILVYKEFFREIEGAAFQSPYLQELQARISGKDGATTALGQLNTLGEAVYMRQNMISYAVINGLFLWDFHCVELFRAWKRAYGEKTALWLDSVGEIEALLSLASLGRVNEVCAPRVLGGGAPALAAEELKHPLLPRHAAVGNSIELKAGTVLITGSNMSGKTTFLRSLGVNLALCYAGGAACAKHFEATIMELATSMRVGDDVGKGISTFYAEILRIKEMVEHTATKQPMLALVDELFKGTNSADRIIGATETVRRLAKPWNITVVTTHDFELCDLEQEPEIRARNYHFSESYEGEKILFDYRIKPGRCRTTNAKFLLRMAGIILDEPKSRE